MGEKIRNIIFDQSNWFSTIMKIIFDHSKSEKKNKTIYKSKLLSSGNLLGILQEKPNNWLKYGISDDNIDNNKILELIAKREEARKNKDFNLADKIRITLNEMNIEIEDTDNGTKWRNKS